MQPTTTSILALATVAACAASHEPLSRQRVELRAATAAPPAPTERDRAGFEQLLARWDAMPDGKARQALAADVDRAAGQRYATVSRLYWYTDMDAAVAAARDSGKPILSLRMLGRLDEDYSCANSRFFRVALYANREVSAFLRDSFVLHWSSERPVPRITVDYGDGRVMRGTIAGNSAHYVLDSEGRPIDVLPGLYSPAAFIDKLQAALPLARRAGALDADALTAALQTFHQDRIAALSASWSQLNIRLPRGGTGIANAQRITASKSMVEMPMVAAMMGQPLERDRWNENLRAQLLASRPGAVELDASSRALIAALAPVSWEGAPARLTREQLDALIGQFESTIAVDTELNEYGIHFQIHGWLMEAKAPPSFAELNQRIYAELFLTPATDPWLGMSAQGTFTGLPGDGLSDAI